MEVHVNTVVGEAVCVKERSRSYVLRCLQAGKIAGASKAETHLSHWAALKAQNLYIVLAGQFPTISFLGTIEETQENGYFVAKHRDSAFVCLFTPRDARCIVEKTGECVTLQISSGQHTVFVSETELTVNEIIQRFRPASGAVH
jgi:hypothetical protein